MDSIINKIFITYSDGQYNALTQSYEPINPIILQDPRVSESLIFDTNRRTIYAQGLEFGNKAHNIQFRTTDGKIYLMGSNSIDANTGYAYINNTTYVEGNSLYTDVSYVTQSYVGENSLTYFNPTGGFVSGKLTVTGHATVTNSLTVSNTVTATTANLTNMNTTYANVTERLRVSSGNEYLGSGPGAQCHLQYDNNEECINFIFD